MENNDVVILNLDKPRILRLGHRALKMASAMTGMSLPQLMDSVDDWLVTSRLCYCMLHAEDESLTEDEVDRLLDRLPVVEIAEKVGQAIAVAFPAPEADEDDGETPPAAAGTGVKA